MYKKLKSVFELIGWITTGIGVIQFILGLTIFGYEIKLLKKSILNPTVYLYPETAIRVSPGFSSQIDDRHLDNVVWEMTDSNNTILGTKKNLISFFEIPNGPDYVKLKLTVKEKDTDEKKDDLTIHIIKERGDAAYSNENGFLIADTNLPEGLVNEEGRLKIYNGLKAVEATLTRNEKGETYLKPTSKDSFLIKNSMLQVLPMNIDTSSKKDFQIIKVSVDPKSYYKVEKDIRINSTTQDPKK